jgi:hypothetical protein
MAFSRNQMNVRNARPTLGLFRHNKIIATTAPLPKRKIGVKINLLRRETNVSAQSQKRKTHIKP